MILWSKQTGEFTTKAWLRDRAKGTLGRSQEKEEENPGLWECEELLAEKVAGRKGACHEPEPPQPHPPGLLQVQ